MKIIDQAGTLWIVQSVKNNLIKVLILSEGMIVVLRLSEGSFVTYQLVYPIGCITFKATHESCEGPLAQTRNDVHMIRHHNRSIENYFSLFIEPLQTAKHNICGPGFLKHRHSVKN